MINPERKENSEKRLSIDSSYSKRLFLLERMIVLAKNGLSHSAGYKKLAEDLEKLNEEENSECNHSSITPNPK